MTIDEGRIPCAGCEAGAPDGARDASDANVAPDDGEAGPAPPTGVRCGTGRCTDAKPVCCSEKLGDYDYRNGACDTAADCRTGDYYTCTVPSECQTAGVHCCIVLDQGAFTRSECRVTCSGGRLCDPDASDCPSGTACVPSTTVPALHECQ